MPDGKEDARLCNHDSRSVQGPVMGIRDHQISTGPPVIVVFELYWATRYFEVWVYGTTGYFNVGIQRGQKLYRRVIFLSVTFVQSGQLWRLFIFEIHVIFGRF